MGNIDNLNRGGNEGNKFGAGRRRNAARSAYLTMDAKGRKFLKAVLDWEQCIPVSDTSGKPKGKRIPTMAEWQWAKSECAKFGIGTRFDAEIEHSGEVEVPGLEDALKRAYGDEPS